MASGRKEAFLRASLLDRLMLPPGSSRGGSQSGIGLRELRESVVRDIDWLLNSKCFLDTNLEGLSEVRTSVLTYGMPDLSSSSWASEKDLGSLARTMEELLRRFEPRLRASSIKVTPPSKEAVQDGRPNFRIDAILQVDPVNEPVSFDTDLDVDSGRLSVRSDG